MIYQGDCLDVLKKLPEESVDCCVTSPPYWGLRDYGMEEQLGLEKTPEEFIEKMVVLFREVRRVLKSDGTLWLNLGDSYASRTKGSGGKTAKQMTNKGSFHGTQKAADITSNFDHGLKDKDLVGIPWRVALALQSDGWYLRQDIIWHKPNPMPESVQDRCTKAHEYIFLLAKSKTYYFDQDSIRENFSEVREGKTLARGNQGAAIARGVQTNPDQGNSGGFAKNHDGKNKRSVWTVRPEPCLDAHFATYPTKLIEPCILAGSRVGGTVLDPFTGSGTTGLVAISNHRKFIGIELNPDYIKIAEKRLSEVQMKLCI